MNDEQRFAFDTWGFLTIEDALTPEQVAALKATVDEKGSDLHSQHSDRGGFWSQEFVDLLDVPVIAAILEEIYGGPRDDGEPPFRIDHINCTPTVRSTRTSPGAPSTATMAGCCNPSGRTS